jgi:hypothetical protein
MRLFFLTIPKPLKQHPFKQRLSIPLSPLAWKPHGLEAEPEANIQGYIRKTPRSLKYFKPLKLAQK